LTGLTGFSGYFFPGFPEESLETQSPPAINENVMQSLL
jgi:hypothetical protein